MKKRVVAVYWRDPTIESGWVEDDHDKDLPLCVTYGVFLKGGDPTVIAGTIAPTGGGEYADRTKFPKGCISKIETISTIEVEKKK